MACASRRWPSTPGCIVRSEVVRTGSTHWGGIGHSSCILAVSAQSTDVRPRASCGMPRGGHPELREPDPPPPHRRDFGQAGSGTNGPSRPAPEHRPGRHLAARETPRRSNRLEPRGEQSSPSRDGKRSLRAQRRAAGSRLPADRGSLLHSRSLHHPRSDWVLHVAALEHVTVLPSESGEYRLAVPHGRQLSPVGQPVESGAEPKKDTEPRSRRARKRKGAGGRKPTTPRRWRGSTPRP
jgi:hypothetical protein